MSDLTQSFMTLLAGGAFLGSMLYAPSLLENREDFGNDDPKYSPKMKQKMQAMRAKYKAAQKREGMQNHDGGYPSYPQNSQFYAKSQAAANMKYQGQMGGGQNVQSNRAFAGPNGALPQSQQNVNLNTSGDQLLSYQLYQQAVNASTPTLQQLNSISGESQQQTGMGAAQLQGGLSADFAPYDILGSGGPPLYDSEFQAVNIGNPRAESISACAQNAPTFVATSLLPKPTIPGQDSWQVGAPENILANQNFLSATQQIGTDTVLSSNRNPSYDIRSDIPNPINVVSPFMNTTITPDLERRPLDCYVQPGEGMYGCGSSGGANQNGTFVGR